MLLSKVINYGGKSVALLAKDNDAYGQTFLDWFAFQSKELGLENKGVFAYDNTTLADMARQAMQSGAEYVVCVPSEIEEIGPMLQISEIQPRDGTSRPRLLFSDTAYGIDVLTVYGDIAEGIEEWPSEPIRNPASMCRTRHSSMTHPQLARLSSTRCRHAHRICGMVKIAGAGSTVAKALRRIVSGEDLNMGSWTGEDMGLVVDALSRGASPYVKGASGHLRFDSKVFTNVLATTYHNFKVYNGIYIILDYNTSDGGNRTEATLAGWNWKASQMQDFNDSGDITYPEHKSNWALLMASSSGWSNY